VRCINIFDENFPKCEVDHTSPDCRPIGRTETSAVSSISGSFAGKNVPLGDIRSDDEGRLIVLGGFGHSEATGLNGAETWIRSYANNDGWFDDVSDGPVEAKVTLHDGGELPIRGASHYEVARPPELPSNKYDRVEFWRDVYPILSRLDGYSWISDIGLRGHGFNKRGAILRQTRNSRDQASQSSIYAPDFW